MGTVNVVNENQVGVICSAATATGAQAAIRRSAPNSCFQAVLTGTGAISATVFLEVSLNGTNWISPGLATITLNGTTTVTDGFATTAPWTYVRINISAISGTGAALTVYIGT